MATFHQLLGLIVLLRCTHIIAGQGEPTPPTHRTRTTRTTMNYKDFLKAKRLKQQLFEYFPNYGFEPYWADGEWFLSTTKAPFISGQTTTQVPRVCGEECSHLLRKIEHVCARNAGEEKHASNACGIWCTGYVGDDHNHGYTTFDTYCQFLDAQCRYKFDNNYRWVLVHVGKCKKLNDYFKPLWYKTEPISRMEWYLSSLGPE